MTFIIIYWFVDRTGFDAVHNALMQQNVAMHWIRLLKRIDLQCRARVRTKASMRLGLYL